MVDISRRQLLAGTATTGLGIGGPALGAGPSVVIDRVAAGGAQTATQLYIGFGHDEWLHYEVHLDAEPEPIYTDDPQAQRYYASNYEVSARDDGTYLLSGQTGTADPDGPTYGDAFRLIPTAGEGILGWEFDVPSGHVDDLRLEVNGKEVTRDAYPPIGEATDETQLYIGFGHDEWLHYEVLLTAEPEPIYTDDPHEQRYYASNYEVSAREDGTYLLSGRTGTANPDGPTYGDAFAWESASGSGILGWRFDVPSGHEDALRLAIEDRVVGVDAYPSVDVFLESAPSVAWRRVFGGQECRARSVIATSDGEFLLAGGRRPHADSESDLWVEKLAADGTTQWRRRFGGDDLDSADAAVETTDGGFLLAGGTWSFGNGDADAWLVKLRTDGALAWRRTIGGFESDSALSAVATSDGGCVFAGYSWTGRTRDAAVGKLDETGEIVWRDTFGGRENDAARSVCQTEDGGYLFAGGTSSYTESTLDAWVVKLDAAGTEAWSETDGGVDPESANAAIETSDGGYLLAGHTDTFTSGDRGGWVVKLDDSGRQEWDTALGGRGRHWFDSAIETTDGGYLLAGSKHVPDADNRNAWLVKLAPNGRAVWSDVYGGSRRDLAHSVIEPGDGEYLFAGDTWSFGLQDSRNAWLVRVAH